MRWKTAAAYASGLVSMRDGVAIEDYNNALAFRIHGIPSAHKWVDELVAASAASSFDGLM